MNKKQTLRRIGLSIGKFRKKLDSIEGCLSILESLSKNHLDVFGNVVGIYADNYFQCLIEGKEREGIDLNDYKRRYDALVKNYDEVPLAMVKLNDLNHISYYGSHTPIGVPVRHPMVVVPYFG